MKVLQHNLAITHLAAKLETKPDELVAWMEDFIDEICDSCQELDFNELSVKDDLDSDQIEQLADMLMGHFLMEHIEKGEIISLLEEVKIG